MAFAFSFPVEFQHIINRMATNAAWALSMEPLIRLIQTHHMQVLGSRCPRASCGLVFPLLLIGCCVPSAPGNNRLLWARRTRLMENIVTVIKSPCSLDFCCIFRFWEAEDQWFYGCFWHPLFWGDTAAAFWDLHQQLQSDIPQSCSHCADECQLIHEHHTIIKRQKLWKSDENDTFWPSLSHLTYK